LRSRHAHHEVLTHVVLRRCTSPQSICFAARFRSTLSAQENLSDFPFWIVHHAALVIAAMTPLQAESSIPRPLTASTMKNRAQVAAPGSGTSACFKILILWWTR
jgi:hypothetical protein